MKQETADARRKLGELAALASRTADDEHRILKRARALLEEVQSEIDSRQADANRGDAEAKDRYQHLVEERGRLNQVIAASLEALQSDE